MNHPYGTYPPINAHGFYKMNHPYGTHLPINAHGFYKMNHPYGTMRKAQTPYRKSKTIPPG